MGSVPAALFIFLAAASDQASAYQGAICGFKEYASLGVITYDEVFIEEHNIPPELDPSTGVYTVGKSGNYMVIVYGSPKTKKSLEVILKKQGITTPSGEFKILTQMGKKDRDLRFWNQVHLAERGRQDPLGAFLHWAM